MTLVEGAVIWPNGKIYFFSGSSYFGYDNATERRCGLDERQSLFLRPRQILAIRYRRESHRCGFSISHGHQLDPVKRKFQYARSSDGRSWLWIGRSKLAGRGEANSELRFDVAVKTTTMR